MSFPRPAWRMPSPSRCAGWARRWSTSGAVLRLRRGEAQLMDRIPILKLGEALLVTIQVDMHDRLAMALEEDLTTRIVEHGAKGVLIDISSLEIVDSFIGRTLANIAMIAKVLDADTVVVGMRPAVAITLVELGLSLPGVRTALNAERGMAMIMNRIADTSAIFSADEDEGGS